MVSQQQGPNQIDSPANLLQQPHNFDVQVSFTKTTQKKNFQMNYIMQHPLYVCHDY